MRVRVTMPLGGRQVDEVIEGKDADEIVAMAKARAARELGWKGFVLNALTPLAFAQKAVSLYNENNNTRYDLPSSAEEFLRLAQDLGFVQMMEEA